MSVENKNLAILNPGGTIEIIEFFDYNCGHCKRESKVVDQLVKLRKDVKVVLKAIPILGQSSLYATQIGHAILISEPDKYFKYFDTLMNDFEISQDPIYNAIQQSNANIEVIKITLKNKDKEIGDMIKKDLELADKYGVQGTPAFVINGKLIPGAVGLEILNKEI